jgi:predicted GNAT family acetyltransferase
MYEFIEGHLVERNPAYAVIDVQGIGYLLNISVHTYSKLKEGARCRLFAHLVVREDALILFGFADLEERELFRQLISVSGVGVNTARIILGHCRRRRPAASADQRDRGQDGAADHCRPEGQGLKRAVTTGKIGFSAQYKEGRSVIWINHTGLSKGARGQGFDQDHRKGRNRFNGGRADQECVEDPLIALKQGSARPEDNEKPHCEEFYCIACLPFGRTSDFTRHWITNRLRAYGW